MKQVYHNHTTFINKKLQKMEFFFWKTNNYIKSWIFYKTFSGLKQGCFLCVFPAVQTNTCPKFWVRQFWDWVTEWVSSVSHTDPEGLLRHKISKPGQLIKFSFLFFTFFILVSTWETFLQCSLPACKRYDTKLIGYRL